MTLKEAAGIIGFIKGLPAYYNDYGPDYRKMVFNQVNNFIEMLKLMVEDDPKKLDIFKEKV